MTSSDDGKTYIQEIDEDRCWELLDGKRVGRLAVSVMNRPDIFPVNYRVDNKTLIVQTAPGEKLAAATLGAAVAFEVDTLDEDTNTGWSVVIKGEANQIDDLEEYLAAEDLGVEPWAAGAKQRFMKIVPDTITGREIPLPD